MIPFPNKKYEIIYADPAWNFKSYSKKGDKKNANQHYDCMGFNDICNLPVCDIAGLDCTLFIWVTDPFLERSFEVIKKWGFTYKTVAFTWAKRNKKSDSYFTGLGYYTRANPEMCLLATKGKPKRYSKSVKQLVVSKLREHSRKPDRIRNDIVELSGDLPRIELFARQKADGWDSWGNEI
jgi:N6-adenosine-specific RNA methylase IME4|tara:strand:- start:7806 stop:8345 length:540 start_codon:yes stop_codon:yes gene_type:complete